MSTECCQEEPDLTPGCCDSCGDHVASPTEHNIWNDLYGRTLLCNDCTECRWHQYLKDE